MLPVPPLTGCRISYILLALKNCSQLLNECSEISTSEKLKLGPLIKKNKFKKNQCYVEEGYLWRSQTFASSPEGSHFTLRVQWQRAACLCRTISRSDRALSHRTKGSQTNYARSIRVASRTLRGYFSLGESQTMGHCFGIRGYFCLRQRRKNFLGNHKYPEISVPSRWLFKAKIGWSFIWREVMGRRHENGARGQSDQQGS